MCSVMLQINEYDDDDDVFAHTFVSRASVIQDVHIYYPLPSRQLPTPSRHFYVGFKG